MAKKQRLETRPFDFGRIPPQAVDIEEAVLGFLIAEAESSEFVYALLKPETFYKEANQKIFSNLLELKHTNKPMDILTLTEQLKKNGVLDEVGGPFYLVGLTGRIMPVSSLKHHCLLLTEKYVLREIIFVCSTFVTKAFNNDVDIFETLDEIKLEIERIEIITNISNVNARDALKDAVEYINDIADGKIVPFLKSGYPKIDYAYGVNLNQIVVFAAQKGHLKTRTLIKFARGWLENNENVAMLWYSMEEPASKMSRLSICHKTGISDLRMQGKRKPPLTTAERQEIGKVSMDMWKDDIEYKESGSSITSIKNNFINFCKKRPGKKHILIIDNYGRTKSGTRFANSNDEDDFIANQYVDIRDATGGLIFIVHHLTKSQLARTNIESGYRPREEEVRGSSRIIDYCNTLILGNYIAKHKDLIVNESQKEIVAKKVTHEGAPQCYIDLLKSINNKPDKEHEAFTFESYQHQLKNTILRNFDQRNLKEHFPNLSAQQAVEFIIHKYQQKVNNVKFQNIGVLTRFRKKVEDPLSFLHKKLYLHPLEVDKESKEFYLYGENIIEIHPKIKNLLILDGAKVRDSEAGDDVVLIRMEVEPGTMKYTEL